VVVGDVEIVPLLDATGELGELAELFPETNDWAPYRAAYPPLFNGSRWVLPCACYLLRAGGANILVDTAVGPAGLWEWDAISEEGLPAELERIGVPPEAVDIVFLTHLHVDHVGWNTDRDGRLFFPEARYLVHRDALAFVRESTRPHVARAIEPVPFEELEGETELGPGITVFPLPGHFPGHMGVRVESGGQTALLIVDAAVNPMLLDRPGDVYVSDVDQVTSVETRRELLPTIVDQDVLVVCGHYPGGGIGRVVRREGRVLWTAA
jgi:glyoxylase-like metal-dependent hydrolase (beta-lactamase superfamily II)